jgi:hypothetical protein
MAATEQHFDPETGEELVWDIFENTYVTRDYWNYVNQLGPYRPVKIKKELS